MVFAEPYPHGEQKMKSKVYFTRDLSPEKVVEMYNALGTELPGKVAVKLHSGEKGNQNFLGPDFWRPMIDKIGGTVVDRMQHCIRRRLRRSKRPYRVAP